jgi:hypothetical protein
MPASSLLPADDEPPAPSSSVRYSLNGIGLWIVTQYLIEIGGTAGAAGWVLGADWQAHVWAGEPFRIGALALGVTEVEINGTAGAVRSVVVAFEKKVMRAGG